MAVIGRENGEAGAAGVGGARRTGARGDSGGRSRLLPGKRSLATSLDAYPRSSHIVSTRGSLTSLIASTRRWHEMAGSTVDVPAVARVLGLLVGGHVGGSAGGAGKMFRLTAMLRLNRAYSTGWPSHGLGGGSGTGPPLGW
jgi:hypothetical protein